MSGIITRKKIAEALNMTVQTLRDRLNNPKTFKIWEIEKLQDLGYDTDKILYAKKYKRIKKV